MTITYYAGPPDRPSNYPIDVEYFVRIDCFIFCLCHYSNRASFLNRSTTDRAPYYRGWLVPGEVQSGHDRLDYVRWVQSKQDGSPVKRVSRLEPLLLHGLSEPVILRLCMDWVDRCLSKSKEQMREAINEAVRGNGSNWEILCHSD